MELVRRNHLLHTNTPQHFTTIKNQVYNDSFLFSNVLVIILFLKILCEQPIIMPFLEKGGQDDLKWEMTFENTNGKHFQPPKKELSTLIANVLGVSSALVDVDLKKLENNENQHIVVVVTLGKAAIPNLKQSIFAFDFISSINKKLADTYKLKGVILSSVTRLNTIGLIGKMMEVSKL